MVLPTHPSSLKIGSRICDLLYEILRDLILPNSPSSFHIMFSLTVHALATYTLFTCVCTRV